jgi:hypothetical protein
MVYAKYEAMQQLKLLLDDKNKLMEACQPLNCESTYVRIGY